MKSLVIYALFLLPFVSLFACSENHFRDNASTDTDQTQVIPGENAHLTFMNAFDGTINIDSLHNYATQAVPNYIGEPHDGEFALTDIGATLGRVLFYDKRLSINNTVSCASCHQQSLAFSDANRASIGVQGTTGRHSMRIVNVRYGEDQRFFWDRRAASLEHQSTEPIQDHIEMGFSGQPGSPDMDDLIQKLQTFPYYNELFTATFGDPKITEERMQGALSQFMRSIVSFDSRFDEGREQVSTDLEPFPNFTSSENSGKLLFINDAVFDANGVRIGGGLGCGSCHRAPLFDIDPTSKNNGVMGSLDGSGPDVTNTRSPSLRDVVQGDGTANGPFMHNGMSTDLGTVLQHYGTMGMQRMNTNIDPRLRPNGSPQRLVITQDETEAVIAFLKTLSGNKIYTEEKWSNPFSN
jgi:cytochrome c peroxidase